MFAVLFLLLQSATPPADIGLRATVKARSLTIQKQGDVELSLTTKGRNVIDIRAPKANGRKTIPNPEITVNVEARIADPNAPPQVPETTAPQ